MNEELYNEYCFWNLYQYHQGRKQLGMTELSCLAYAFDGSVPQMGTRPRMAVATVITLSIISIREGFLPDYLDAMLSRIRDISDILDNEERIYYQNDLRTLEVLKHHVPYSVIKTDTSFMSEIDSLTPSSVLNSDIQ